MDVVMILFVVVFFGDSLVFENVHVIIGSVVDRLGFVLVVSMAVVVLLVWVVLLVVVVLFVVVVLIVVVVVLLVVVVVLLVVEVVAVVVVVGLLVVRFVVVVDLLVGSELFIALGLILLKIFSCHQGIVVGLVVVVVQNSILAGILLLVFSADVVLGDMEVVVLILVVVFVGSGNKADAENISESNFSSARFAFV